MEAHNTSGGDASESKRSRKRVPPHRPHKAGEEGMTGDDDDDRDDDDPPTVDEMVLGAHCNVDDDDDDVDDDHDNDETHQPIEVRGTRGEGQGREKTRKGGKNSFEKKISENPPPKPLKAKLSKTPKP